MGGRTPDPSTLLPIPGRRVSADVRAGGGEGVSLVDIIDIITVRMLATGATVTGRAAVTVKLMGEAVGCERPTLKEPACASQFSPRGGIDILGRPPTSTRLSSAPLGANPRASKLALGGPRGGRTVVGTVVGLRRVHPRLESASRDTAAVMMNEGDVAT